MTRPLCSGQRRPLVLDESGVVPGDLAVFRDLAASTTYPVKVRAARTALREAAARRRSRSALREEVRRLAG